MSKTSSEIAIIDSAVYFASQNLTYKQQQEIRSIPGGQELLAAVTAHKNAQPAPPQKPLYRDEASEMSDAISRGDAIAADKQKSKSHKS